MPPTHLTQTHPHRKRLPMISRRELRRILAQETHHQPLLQLLLSITSNARTSITYEHEDSQIITQSRTTTSLFQTHTTHQDAWLYKLQNTPTRSDEIKGLDTIATKVDDALRAGHFDKVNRWITISQSLTLAPLIAVGLFRFSTAARRKHPEHFPAWKKAIQTLYQKLKALGLDADHKLRGLPDL